MEHEILVLTEVDTEFKWKDRYDNFHRTKDMSTHHLYSTLKMVWNIFVKAEYRIAPVNLYTLSSFYTSEYLARGVKAMMEELSTRHDLNIHQRIGLDLMIARASSSDNKLILLQK